jgi:EF-hand domain pair
MNRKTIAFSAAAVTIAAALAGVAIARDHGGHGGHHDPFGDKTVTRAEVSAHAAAKFAEHDANKDGKLDAADRTAHHGAKFEQHDTNKDGAISRAEFDAAHQGGMAGGAGMSGHGKGEHRGKHMAMMMLHMADANKDKAVSKDEFVAAHAAMFDKADADKDGKLTPAERQAAHAKMREAMKGMHGTSGADAHAGH